LVAPAQKKAGAKKQGNRQKRNFQDCLPVGLAEKLTTFNLSNEHGLAASWRRTERESDG
jgi:hypothetical protein